VPFSHALFLFLAALVAGLLNSVAGGGSFISFPALLFVGVAPIAANATSTVALWPGAMASAVAYRREFHAEARRLLPPLLIIGVFGGLLGAHILLRTPPHTFLRLVPWLLLGATLLFVVSGRLTAWVRTRTGQTSATRRIPPVWIAAGLLLEFMIAIYIGYFGAGVGILVLALLAFLGMENIHAMNAVKTLLVSIVNAVAAIAFIVAHQIVWIYAVLMVFGAALGGYTGAFFAQKTNPRYVRWLVIAVGFGVSLYFFIRYR
jgi:uncharacterized protein